MKMGSIESENAIVETTLSSWSQEQRSTFFIRFSAKESEAYLKKKTVTLAPAIVLFFDFHFP